MGSELLYRRYAQYYDQVYAYRDYERQADFVTTMMERQGIEDGRILDVCCGTGSHAEKFVAEGYDVTGVDKNPAMIEVAQDKVPEARFVQGDMRTFSLDERFDVIQCLFTAINYNPSYDELVETLQNFRSHLSEGGAIIFDAPTPYVGDPETIPIETEYGHGLVLYDFIPSGNNRITTTIYWQIPAEDSEYTVEKDEHRLQFYTLEEYRSAIRDAELDATMYRDYDTQATEGRPVFVCTTGT